MVRGKLIWSPESRKDRASIFIFWNKKNKSKSYSRRLSKLFRLETKRLLKTPYIGKATKTPELRLLFIEHFIILYRIKSNAIEIVNVWDGRRNPDDFEKLIQKRN